jgi:L-fuculose-phosphate aldolase
LALEALGQGHAVLLSNTGALTTGATLEAALVRAQELETLARLYAIALSVGRPAVLSDEEVGRIAERLKSNGADVEARIAPPIKARTKAKAPAKMKRIARKRRSKKKTSPRKRGAVKAPVG